VLRLARSESDVYQGLRHQETPLRGQLPARSSPSPLPGAPLAINLVKRIRMTRKKLGRTYCGGSMIAHDGLKDTKNPARERAVKALWRNFKKENGQLDQSGKQYSSRMS